MMSQCPDLLPESIVSTATQGQLRLCITALNFSIIAYKLPTLGQEASAPRASVSSSVTGYGKSPAPWGFRTTEFMCAFRTVPAGTASDQ